MIELLHLGSIVPATVGVCCTVGDRRSRSAVAWAPAIVMLAAMVDSMTGSGVISPVMWALALMGLAVWPAVVVRLGRRYHSGATRSLSAAMGIHRSISLLIMAALLLVSGSKVSSPSSATGHHTAAVPMAVALWIATIALVVFTLWLVAALSRRQPGRATTLAALLAPLESASMAVAAVMMTLAFTTS
ncbi:flagellar biogenesis protein FliO [Salinibacterium sp. CAN_S4]|uniref:hypothetical protein n=1 Tax=Salinibacterium sp. CAN_S4 TaxID=2787727 RepID=UPI0018EF5672